MKRWIMGWVVLGALVGMAWADEDRTSERRLDYDGRARIYSAPFEESVPTDDTKSEGRSFDFDFRDAGRSPAFSPINPYMTYPMPQDERRTSRKKKRENKLWITATPEEQLLGPREDSDAAKKSGWGWLADDVKNIQADREGEGVLDKAKGDSRREDSGEKVENAEEVNVVRRSQGEAETSFRHEPSFKPVDTTTSFSRERVRTESSRFGGSSEPTAASLPGLSPLAGAGDPSPAQVVREARWSRERMDNMMAEGSRTDGSRSMMQGLLQDRPNGLKPAIPSPQFSSTASAGGAAPGRSSGFSASTPGFSATSIKPMESGFGSSFSPTPTALGNWQDGAMGGGISPAVQPSSAGRTVGDSRNAFGR